MNYVITEAEFNRLYAVRGQLRMLSQLLEMTVRQAQMGTPCRADDLGGFLDAQSDVLTELERSIEARHEAQRQAEPMNPGDWLYLIRILSGHDAQTPSGSALAIDGKLRAAAELDSGMQPVHAAWLDALVEAGERQRQGKYEANAHLVGEAPAEMSPTNALAAYVSKNAQNASDCIAIGRELLQLKESCRHGEFLKRLEALPMEAPNAQYFMAAARRFANSAAQSLVTAAGGIAKLRELLALNDAQIEALEQTGVTGRLTLADIQTMTARQLRAAIRKERQETTAADAPQSAKPRRTREKLAAVPA